MTDHDCKLLHRAHDLRAHENQDIQEMIPLAESYECRDLLRIHFQYLANKEKLLAEV